MTNITDTIHTQDFAALRANFYRTYEALCLRADEIEETGKGDTVMDAYSDAASAVRVAVAPDFAAVIDKLYIILNSIDLNDGNSEAVKSIITDISNLTGEPQFNPAAWLCDWVSFDGGYVVQDGSVKLVSPLGTTNPNRARLLQQLEDMDGRESLEAHILAWADDDMQYPPAIDFKDLKQALSDASEKVENKNNSDQETNEFSSEHFQILQKLMAYPVTNGEDLACKLKIFRELECGEFVEEIRNPMLDALEADASRLK